MDVPESNKLPLGAEPADPTTAAVIPEPSPIGGNSHGPAETGGEVRPGAAFEALDWASAIKMSAPRDRLPAWCRVATAASARSARQGKTIMKRVGACTGKFVVASAPLPTTHRSRRRRLNGNKPSGTQQEGPLPWEKECFTEAQSVHDLLQAKTDVANAIINRPSMISYQDVKAIRAGKFAQTAGAKRRLDDESPDTRNPAGKAGTGPGLYNELEPLIVAAWEETGKLSVKSSAIVETARRLQEIRRNPRRCLALHGIPDLSTIADVTEPESSYAFLKPPKTTVASTSPLKRKARLADHNASTTGHVMKKSRVSLSPSAAPAAAPSPTKSSAPPSPAVSSGSPTVTLQKLFQSPASATASPAKSREMSSPTGSARESGRPQPASSVPSPANRPDAPTPSRWNRDEPSTPAQFHTPTATASVGIDHPNLFASMAWDADPLSSPAPFNFGATTAEHTHSAMRWFLGDSDMAQEANRTRKVNQARRRKSEPLVRSHLKAQSRRKSVSPMKRDTISVDSVEAAAEIPATPSPLSQRNEDFPAENTLTANEFTTPLPAYFTAKSRLLTKTPQARTPSRQNDIFSVDMRQNMDIFGTQSTGGGKSPRVVQQLAHIVQSQSTEFSKVVVTEENERLVVRFKLPTKYSSMFTVQELDESRFTTTPSAISSSPRIAFGKPNTKTGVQDSDESVIETTEAFDDANESVLETTEATHATRAEAHGAIPTEADDTIPAGADDTIPAERVDAISATADDSISFATRDSISTEADDTIPAGADDTIPAELNDAISSATHVPNSTKADDTILAGADDTIPAELDDTIPAEIDDAVPATANGAISATADDAVSSATYDAIPIEADDTIPAGADDTIPAKLNDAISSAKHNSISIEADDTIPAGADDTIPAELDDAIPATAHDAISSETHSIPTEADDTIPAGADDTIPAELDDAISSEKDGDISTKAHDAVHVEADNVVSAESNHATPCHEDGQSYPEVDATSGFSNLQRTPSNISSSKIGQSNADVPHSLLEQTRTDSTGAGSPSTNINPTPKEHGASFDQAADNDFASMQPSGPQSPEEGLSSPFARHDMDKTLIVDDFDEPASTPKPSPPLMTEAQSEAQVKFASENPSLPATPVQQQKLKQPLEAPSSDLISDLSFEPSFQTPTLGPFDMSATKNVASAQAASASPSKEAGQKMNYNLEASTPSKHATTLPPTLSAQGSGPSAHSPKVDAPMSIPRLRDSFSPVNAPGSITKVNFFSGNDNAVSAKDPAPADVKSRPTDAGSPVRAAPSARHDDDSPNRDFMRDFIRRSKPKRLSTTETGSPMAHAPARLPLGAKSPNASTDSPQKGKRKLESETEEKQVALKSTGEPAPKKARQSAKAAKHDQEISRNKSKASIPNSDEDTELKTEPAMRRSSRLRHQDDNSASQSSIPTSIKLNRGGVSRGNLAVVKNSTVRSEQADLARQTNLNTKRNRGNPEAFRQVLARGSEELSEEEQSSEGSTSQTTTKRGKNVSWKTPLEAHHDEKHRKGKTATKTTTKTMVKTTTKTEIPKSSAGISKPKAAASVGSGPATPARASKVARSLGMAGNGTPAKRMTRSQSRG